MNSSTVVGASVAGLVIARWAAQITLERLNQRHVVARSHAVPEAFEKVVDLPTYTRSIDYTLARTRLHKAEGSFDAILLLGALSSGVLPWLESVFKGWFGGSAWSMAAFLFVVGVLLALARLPFGWYSQFRVEEQFGFNTCATRLWWNDRLKSLLLAVGLGYPLLVLLLKTMEWTGTSWWFWTWLCLLGIQLLMIAIAPTLILPLFNRLTPLPDGSLRERLLNLGTRTDFPARSIQLIDGSKRSRHSNAFFTGFGRFRRIVLFDTLLHQLTEPEVEAVLAHEIGHWKKRHVTKMLVWSAAASLAGIYLLSRLAGQPWCFSAFGFPSGNPAATLLLCSILIGPVAFWISPALNLWSQHNEYEADAFAAEVLREPGPLIDALRKLNKENLSNLTPHPLYRQFYYSHPGLAEREAALCAASM